MGRKLLYSIINVWAIVSMGCLMSCQDYAPFDDHDLTTYSYEKEFVKAFGMPVANHDFGFVDQPVVAFEDDTRAVHVNSNQWYDLYHDHLNIPGYPHHLHNTIYCGTNSQYATTPGDAGNPKGDITDEEREFVWNWFSNNRNPISTSVHWESFFIQYVDSWAGRNPGSRIMDQLGCRYIDGSWEHINNFNATTNAFQYVTSSGTENWSYRASWNNSYHENLYTIQHLVFDIPQAANQCPFGVAEAHVHHYDGWYVAFDYEAVKTKQEINQQTHEYETIEEPGSVHADGYFNDLITKVSPGNLVGTPETVRVMCEDLGGTSDWDFNDVVFDVSFRNYHGKVFACIALQAAGGTLPITVGTRDERYEVHALLGDGSLKPIIHPATYAYYEVEMNNYNSYDNTANAANIPIYVNNSSEAIYYTIANASNIAQKFACSDDVQWTEENEDIRSKYPNLTEWIRNGGSANWATPGGNNQQNNNEQNNNQTNNNEQSNNQSGDNQMNENQPGDTQIDEEKGSLATLIPNPDGNFAFDIDKSAFATAQTKVIFTFVKKNGVALNGVITKISNYTDLVRVEDYSNANQLTIVVTDKDIINEIKTNGMSYRNYAGTDPDVFVKCE